MANYYLNKFLTVLVEDVLGFKDLVGKHFESLFKASFVLTGIIFQPVLP